MYGEQPTNNAFTSKQTRKMHNNHKKQQKNSLQYLPHPYVNTHNVRMSNKNSKKPSVKVQGREEKSVNGHLAKNYKKKILNWFMLTIERLKVSKYISQGRPDEC